MTAARRIWAVVMAGGSGTRFWPASTASRPKQLSRIVGDSTMLQATVSRVRDQVDEVLVITTSDLTAEARRQLPDLPPERVIGEPSGRDTAPCVALAAELVQASDPGAVMVLLPSDHVIEPAEVFAASVARGVEVAAEGHLVTFAVPPRFASTGYGYLRAVDSVEGHAGVRRVERFVEKPDQETAEAYLDEGGYYWNSGIFCWRADVVLEALSRHCGELASTMRPIGQAWGTRDFDQALVAAYEAVEPISIDYALMEHAEDVVAVIADWQWDDLGSWDAVSAHHEADPAGNVVVGDGRLLDGSNTMLYQLDGPLVVGVGIDDLVVVSTEKAVLVLRKGRGQDVKSVVEQLREEGRTDLL